MAKSSEANLSGIASTAAAGHRIVATALAALVTGGSVAACGCGGDAAPGPRLIALIAQVLVRLVTRGGRRQKTFGSAQRGGRGSLNPSAHGMRCILGHKHFILKNRSFNQ